MRNSDTSLRGTRSVIAELFECSAKFGREFEGKKLTEPAGIAFETRFDALIVSPETEDRGEHINDRGEERGCDLLPLKIANT
nr:hypothetical protein [Natrinema soli]